VCRTLFGGLTDGMAWSRVHSGPGQVAEKEGREIPFAVQERGRARVAWATLRQNKVVCRKVGLFAATQACLAQSNLVWGDVRLLAAK
jgi:hypothetical protein